MSAVEVFSSKGDGGWCQPFRAEKSFVEERAIKSERAQHNAVHEHPANKRWGGAFV